MDEYEGCEWGGGSALDVEEGVHLVRYGGVKVVGRVWEFLFAGFESK